MYIPTQEELKELWFNPTKCFFVKAFWLLRIEYTEDKCTDNYEHIEITSYEQLKDIIQSMERNPR